MKPKFNKLITLLLLSSIFVFLMKAEDKLKSVAEKELSGWVSLLPDSVSTESKEDTINPYSEPVNLLEVATSLLKKGRSARKKESELSINPL